VTSVYCNGLKRVEKLSDVPISDRFDGFAVYEILTGMTWTWDDTQHIWLSDDYNSWVSDYWQHWG